MIDRIQNYFEKFMQRLDIIKNERNMILFRRNRNAGKNHDIFISKWSQKGIIEGKKNNFLIKTFCRYLTFYFLFKQHKKSKFVRKKILHGFRMFHTIKMLQKYFKEYGINRRIRKFTIIMRFQIKNYRWVIMKQPFN